VERAGVWGLRLAWAALPFTFGTAVGDALASATRGVQIVGSAGLWLAWAVGLVCTLVPRSVTLTAIRIAAPVPLALAVATAATEDVSLIDALACAHAGAVVLLAFTPSVGEAFVDGSSYGDERRFPLRVPAALLLGPVELAWLLVAAPIVAGPLLLAAEQWLAGTLVLVAGAVVVRRALRSLHGLAQRWLVLVPAGAVLHDPFTLAEPILFRRGAVRRLGVMAGRAAGDDDATLDLTAGASGLALEVVLAGEVELALHQPRGGVTAPARATRVRFAPTRPGAVLAVARDRGIAVG
jgi:hypothetical protein